MRVKITINYNILLISLFIKLCCFLLICSQNKIEIKYKNYKILTLFLQHLITNSIHNKN